MGSVTRVIWADCNTRGNVVLMQLLSKKEIFNLNDSHAVIYYA